MVVVDASLAVKFAVNEEFALQARTLAHFWESAGVPLSAPDFMPSEFASALRKKIPDGFLTIGDVRTLISDLYESGIDFRPSRTLHIRAIDLAVQLNQRLAYDSHYLALAESLNCDFWTADRRFHRAAQGPYPQVRWIGDYQPDHEVNPT